MMESKERNLFSSRLSYLAGIAAPVLFITTVILGGILRPGYSHLSETISELFSPGSPNKPLLDLLHSTYALLLICFGMGLRQFIKAHPKSLPGAMLGSWLYIAMGLLSLSTATIFPQDPWGTAPTFPGKMHMYVSGILSIITLAAMALIGSWFSSSGTWPFFRPFSWLIIILSIGSAVIYIISMNTPLMGLAERASALIGFSWTLCLSIWLLKEDKPA